MVLQICRERAMAIIRMIEVIGFIHTVKNNTAVTISIPFRIIGHQHIVKRNVGNGSLHLNVLVFIAQFEISKQANLILTI